MKVSEAVAKLSPMRASSPVPTEEAWGQIRRLYLDEFGNRARLRCPGGKISASAIEALVKELEDWLRKVCLGLGYIQLADIIDKESRRVVADYDYLRVFEPKDKRLERKANDP